MAYPSTYFAVAAEGQTGKYTPIVDLHAAAVDAVDLVVNLEYGSATVLRIDEDADGKLSFTPLAVISKPTEGASA